MEEARFGLVDDLLQLPIVVVELPFLMVDVPAEKIEIRSHDKLKLLFNVNSYFCEPEDVRLVRNREWEARTTLMEIGERQGFADFK